MNPTQIGLGTRLFLEELEPRALLSAGGLGAGSQQDILVDLGTGAAVTTPPVYSGALATPGPFGMGFGALALGLGNPVGGQFSPPAAPDANTGVGQMTITNGANTPGISSFATPTMGSQAGGTGGPVGLALPAPNVVVSLRFDFDGDQEPSTLRTKVHLASDYANDAIFDRAGRGEYNFATDQSRAPVDARQ